MGIDISKFDKSAKREGMGRGYAYRSQNGDDKNRLRDRIEKIRAESENKIQTSQAQPKPEVEVKPLQEQIPAAAPQDDAAIEQNLDDLFAKYRASFSLEDENNLRDYAAKNDLTLAVYPKVSKDERSEIARIAFDGVVSYDKNNSQYSPEYRKIVAAPMQYASKPRKPEDYNMDDSGLWKVMKQFPEFVSIENRIKGKLAVVGVPPEILPSMNMSDFKHFLFNHCGCGPASSKAKIFPQLDANGNIMRDLRTQNILTTSAKQKNTIKFINSHPEFRDAMMKIPNARADYVDELIKQMKQGKTDMTGYLAKHPEWKDQQSINVHHIINIKDIRMLEEQGRPLSDINSSDNMCFMGSGSLEFLMANQKKKVGGIHHVIHKNEMEFSTQKWGEKSSVQPKDVVPRLQPKEGICCMLSFGVQLKDASMKYIVSQKDRSQQTQRNNSNSRE